LRDTGVVDQGGDILSTIESDNIFVDRDAVDKHIKKHATKASARLKEAADATPGERYGRETPAQRQARKQGEQMSAAEGNRAMPLHPQPLLGVKLKAVTLAETLPSHTMTSLAEFLPQPLLAYQGGVGVTAVELTDDQLRAEWKHIGPYARGLIREEAEAGLTQEALTRATNARDDGTAVGTGQLREKMMSFMVPETSEVA
jgi:hypothetical protein